MVAGTTTKDLPSIREKLGGSAGGQACHTVVLVG